MPYHPLPHTPNCTLHYHPLPCIPPFTIHPTLYHTFYSLPYIPNFTIHSTLYHAFPHFTMHAALHHVFCTLLYNLHLHFTTSTPCHVCTCLPHMHFHMIVPRLKVEQQCTTSIYMRECTTIHKVEWSTFTVFGDQPVLFTNCWSGEFAD